MKNNFIVLDVETGGREEDKHPITQIALQVINPSDFSVITSYDTFIQPYNNLTITKAALEYSRVSMQQINNGKKVDVVMKDLIAIVKQANKSGRDSSKPILCGHNVAFDKKFLEYMFAYRTKSLYDYFDEWTFDTMRYSQLYEGDALKFDENSRFSLTACCERFGIELHTAHNAVGDVEATVQLFKKLVTSLRSGNNKIADDGVTNKRNRTKQRDNFFFELPRS